MSGLEPSAKRGRKCSRVDSAKSFVSCPMCIAIWSPSLNGSLRSGEGTCLSTRGLLSDVNSERRAVAVKRRASLVVEAEAWTLVASLEKKSSPVGH